MSHKIDPARARNFASVLQEIFAAPGRSRKDIADAIGISVASVTSIAASLLEHRLISESAPVAAGQGRPRVPLSVDTDSNLVMGIHLGPRVTGIVLTGLDGVAKASVLVPHSGMAAATAFELVIAQAQKLVADHADGRPVLGTGVATGGIVDREQGLIVENAGAGWSQVPAQRMLEALPQPLVLDNNARAAVAVGDLGARSLRDQGQTLQIPSQDQNVVRYFEADQQAEAVK